MKRAAVAVGVLLMLSGCAFTGSPPSSVSVPLSTPTSKGTEQIDNVSIELDRYGDHAFTVSQQEATKRKALDVEAKEAEARTAEANSKTTQDEHITILVDSAEALTQLALKSAIDRLGEANDGLRQVAIALAQGKGGGKRVITFGNTPMPEGAFAEGVKAVGVAGGQILKAPALTTFAFLEGAARLAGKVKTDDPGTKIQADGDVNLNDSLNKTTAQRDQLVVKDGTGTQYAEKHDTKVNSQTGTGDKTLSPDQGVDTSQPAAAVETVAEDTPATTEVANGD